MRFGLGGDVMYIDRVKFAMYVAQKKVKLSELANKSELSRTTVSNIKNGKSGSRETIEKLANGLGVEVEELIESEV